MTDRLYWVLNTGYWVLNWSYDVRKHAPKGIRSNSAVVTFS